MKRPGTLLAILLTLGLVGGVAPAFGQPTDCTDGIVHDDGTFENGYGASQFASRAHYAMRVDPSSVPALLGSVCVCWLRAGADSTIFFDIKVWDSDGPDGRPGTLLGTLETVSSTGVSTTTRKFYRYDLSALGIQVERPVFIGPLWDPGDDEDFFVCADENGPTSQPAYASTSIFAEIDPPVSQLGQVGAFPSYRNLGVRAVFESPEPEEGSLSELAGLIVPGFAVEVGDPEGPTLQFAVRNTTDTTIDVDIAYHGNQVATPLRTDELTLEPQATTAWDVRFDLSDLEVVDGFATGLAIITEAGETTASPLEGDYFRIDSGNDFATGNRLVRPSDFCQLQEARIVDFGSGTQYRILLDVPRGGGEPSFSYTAYDFSGNMTDTGEYFTSDHLTVLTATDLGIQQSFGTVVFDFSNSSGGWVSSRYSAFDRFAVEIPSACRD